MCRVSFQNSCDHTIVVNFKHLILLYNGFPLEASITGRNKAVSFVNKARRGLPERSYTSASVFFIRPATTLIIRTDPEGNLPAHSSPEGMSAYISNIPKLDMHCFLRSYPNILGDE